MNYPFSISKKNYIRIFGTVVYFIFLILTFSSILIFKLYWGILNPIDFVRILLILFLCAFPAGLSSLVVSYLNQDRDEGVRSLFFVAFVFGAINLIFSCFFLLPIYLSPPRDQYESLARTGIFIALLLFTLFFLFPLAALSIVFSVIFGHVGYKLSLSGKNSFSVNSQY
ncbi:MAG: hypothetical protein ACFFC6_11555 [Promethearchaeota archaeon]